MPPPAQRALPRIAQAQPKLGMYGLVGLVAVYVVLSSYFIVDTRSRLAYLEANQKASVENLWQRQAITSHRLAYLTDGLAKRQGMAEQWFYDGMRSQAIHCRRQQETLEARLRQRQNEQIGKLDQAIRLAYADAGELSELRIRDDLPSLVV